MSHVNTSARTVLVDPRAARFGLTLALLADIHPGAVARSPSTTES